MGNRTIIQQSLDYIEDNLRTEIAATELADMAGFSLFHYYRLFQQATGLPVMLQQRVEVVGTLPGLCCRTQFDG